MGFIQLPRRSLKHSSWFPWRLNSVCHFGLVNSVHIKLPEFTVQCMIKEFYCNNEQMLLGIPGICQVSDNVFLCRSKASNDMWRAKYVRPFFPLEDHPNWTGPTFWWAILNGCYLSLSLITCNYYMFQVVIQLHNHALKLFVLVETCAHYEANFIDLMLTCFAWSDWIAFEIKPNSF